MGPKDLDPTRFYTSTVDGLMPVEPISAGSVVALGSTVTEDIDDDAFLSSLSCKFSLKLHFPVSRKAFVKRLMGIGWSRNLAGEIADVVKRCRGRLSYQNAYLVLFSCPGFPVKGVVDIVKIKY